MLLMDIRIEKLKIKNDLKDNNFLTELSNADDNESALLLYYEMMKTILKALFVCLFFFLGNHAIADNLMEGNRLFDAGQYKEAMTFLMQPDVHDDPEALNLVAYMYNHGLGVSKNAEKAFMCYMKSAESGLAIAQFNVGLAYEQGNGILKNLPEAVKWYRKAAEQEDADAEAKMGYLTVNGIGIGKNYKEAMKWYQRAAEHGDYDSYADIGMMYSRGDGVKRNLNHAVQYYIFGAQKGSTYSQALLGNAYAYGKGIQKDIEQALYCTSRLQKRKRQC